MFSLVQLEYLVAVDTWRHFALAAEKCFVTQPTLSMQLKKMETDLDIVLFDRSKQPVVPTLAGEKLISQARHILRERNKFDSLVNELKGQINGTLRLGIIPSLAPFLLPLFIGAFLKKYPDIQLIINELLSNQIIDALKHDTIDAAILVTPLHQPELKEIPLFTEGILLYISPDHELSKLPEITFSNLDKHDIWLLGTGHCFRNQVINLCSLQQKRVRSLNIEYESGSLETLIKMVDKYGGLTLIPELMVMNLTEEQKENVRYFTDELPLREVSMVVNRIFAKEKIISLLNTEVKANIPQDMLNFNRGKVVEWI